MSEGDLIEALCQCFCELTFQVCSVNPAIGLAFFYISLFVVAIVLTVKSNDSYITVNACVTKAEPVFNEYSGCNNVCVYYKYVINKSLNQTGTCTRTESICYDDYGAAAYEAKSYDINSCRDIYLSSYSDSTCSYYHSGSTMLSIAIMFWVFFGLFTIFLIYLASGNTNKQDRARPPVITNAYTFNPINSNNATNIQDNDDSIL